jgi:poly-gamma-glutamate synthesis protein (capsule biosynthesis protein)
MRIVLQGGDNMLGRAIQLTLPYQTPGDANITDSQSAQDYLNDILPDINIENIRSLNMDGSYLWGDLPYDLNEDIRILNLEAAPTISIHNQDIPIKSIHYHININNLSGIFSKFIRPYVLCLANNHSMDMGRTAFIQETLNNNFSEKFIGVGNNKAEAYTPKIIGNIVILAFGAGCSGVPNNWEATENQAGIAYLPPIINKFNVNTAFEIIRSSLIQIPEIKNKCIIISIHWGPNEASINDGQQYRELLAHRLIDELNVSIIYGHSSHHIRGIELYKEKLILYGAGDFINDYEEISSNYNRDGALYILDLNNSNYDITTLTFIPFETKKLRCTRITDYGQIKSLKAFVNKQSIRDSTNPIII